MKCLVKIAEGPKLFLDPALLDLPGIFLKLLRRRVVGAKCFVNCFGSEHAAFDCGVNAFEALRIQKTCGIADDEAAIHKSFRHGIPAAIWDGFRTVADDLATVEHAAHKRMRFELLKCFVRIEK